MAKIKKKPPPKIKDNLLTKKDELDEAKENFKVSFEHLDTSQKYGSSFRDWQKVGLLSTMMETLRGYCCSPLLEQKDGQKFAIYGDFPSDSSLFEEPRHTPPDALWARIHINNKSIVAGHIVRSTFYVVFLDKTHKFYMTKNTKERYKSKK